jgi:hypothetical protein
MIMMTMVYLVMGQDWNVNCLAMNHDSVAGVEKLASLSAGPSKVLGVFQILLVILHDPRVVREFARCGFTLSVAGLTRGGFLFDCLSVIESVIVSSNFLCLSHLCVYARSLLQRPLQHSPVLPLSGQVSI